VSNKQASKHPKKVSARQIIERSSDVGNCPLWASQRRRDGYTLLARFDWPRKLLDVSRLARLGWTARITLEDGIRETYDWFLAQGDDGLRMA